MVDPTAGIEFTVITAFAVFVQPLTPVPVTVYVDVETGVKETPFVMLPVHE
jgi:hypothetical protein